MEEKIKILIADDHPIIREGLRRVLESNFEMLHCTEASNGEEAYNYLVNDDFEIATLDVEMPKINGLDLARKIKLEKINTKIVFLTMYKEESMFNSALDLDAVGYVLKDNAVVDIVKCIKEVMDNNYYISPAISHLLLNRKNRIDDSSQELMKIDSLTKSEKKILGMIADEKTSREIAEHLFISIKTVENHRSNISKKLGLHGSHSLIKFALQNRTIL